MAYLPPFFFGDFLAALFFAALFLAAGALFFAAAFFAAGFLAAPFFAALFAFDFEAAFAGVSSPLSPASAARRARSAPFDVVRLAGAG